VNPPIAFLITGVPGAGKTTVSRALASRLERAVHLDCDELQRLVVSGLTWPGDDPPEEAELQLDLRARNAAALAANFLDAGFTVAIDEVVVGPRRLSMYQEALNPRPLELVVLAPPLEVALERDRLRPDRNVGDRWAHLDAEMREKLAGHGLWLDSGDLTVDETVDAILDRLA
jgi:adenylylsulfate kinase-like enzyme